MDIISGASALSWCIELEKGLRSNKPGYPIESIRRIGHNLNQWNRERQLSIGVCNIYGLVPGEDRLFRDAILLKIVDAFVSRDKETRMSIVKVFLFIIRNCKDKDGYTHGIFSNMSTEIRLELLRRIKAVLQVDCVKSRASAIILFGCWAELAKDVAEIRDLVLSSLTSRHVLEVKASLFTAGCFSELSDDFGYVYLEKLLALIENPTTSPALRIAGARSIAKMGCSLLLAVRTYKAGAELLQKDFEEEVSATMLMALTQVSLKIPILIPEQVVVLCSFLSETINSDMHARVLRCVRLIMENSACFMPSGSFPFQCLFIILDEQSTPSAVRCEIFQILLKMITHGLLDMLLNDTEEFMKLMRYIENAARSPFLSERLLAFESFVCISLKLNGTEKMSEADLANFSFGVTSTILDKVTVLSNRLPGDTSSSEVGKELGKMLRLLLELSGGNSKLGYFILDRLHLIIENFVNLHNITAIESQNSEVHKIVETGSKGKLLPPRVLMFNIHKFLVGFIETLNEAGGITEQVLCKLKNLICFVCGNSFLDCSIHTFYALIWHSRVNQNPLSAENEISSKSIEDLDGFPSKLLECETVIDMCAKNMLEGGDNWCAYKAGRYAACEGEWDVANYIFHHLVKRVQSDVFCEWLKLLVQLTNSEKNVKSLLHQKCICFPLDHKGIEQLVEACAAISSSDKVMEAISVKTQAFYFQRWFMGLRLQGLLILMDILKILDNFLLCKNGMESTKDPGDGDVASLDGLHSRLDSLAQECDLVISSFIDMDSTSLKIVSDIALSCSILAFFTKFTTLLILRNPTEASEDCLNVIVKNIVGRLWHVDSETCMNLLSLLEDNGVHKRSLNFRPNPRLSKIGFVLSDFLTTCSYGVKRAIQLKHQTLSVGNEGAILQFYKDAMESFLHVAKAWMQLPWQIPNYFFRIRRTMGAHLFWSSPGVRKQREIPIPLGNHLVLNLCIQLKDQTSDTCTAFSKLYCILYCQKSLSMEKPPGESSTQTHTSYRASAIDTMINLNKKLQGYVMKQTREFAKCNDVHNAGEFVEACVCFETNGRSQGFSTCVLDVSSFPAGSYRICWHSGGIDNHGAYWSFLPLCPGPQFTVR